MWNAASCHEGPPSGEYPALADLSAIEDADELCRRPLEPAWGCKRSSRCAEAVDLLARVHRTGTLPGAFRAMLLCTDDRWDLVTGKLVGAIEASRVLRSADFGGPDAAFRAALVRLPGLARAGARA